MLAVRNFKRREESSFLERLKTSSEAPFNFVSLRESYHNSKIMSQEDQDKINVPEPMTFSLI